MAARTEKPKVRYRSISGDVFDAEVNDRCVLTVGELLSIEAIFPNKRRVELRAIRYVGPDIGNAGTCFDCEGTNG